MTYNLRTSSLVGAHLDAALTKRGAKTFGTTQRKQARLNRFIEAENNAKTVQSAILTAVVEERQKIQTRSRAVATRSSPRLRAAVTNAVVPTRSSARLSAAATRNQQVADEKQAIYNAIVDERQKVQTRARTRVLDILSQYLGY